METPANIKFENSPADSLADSFVSTPGTAYPPLFDDEPSHNGMDAMTPQSYDDNFRSSTMDPSIAGSPAPEKKPVKKRKSWGQQLPEPKTNLPPRKRAKTEDEKEQRRVERVLRNRRAAQSSRERKRLEVEKLEAEKHAVERRAKDLELRLQEMEERNMALTRQLEQLGGSIPVFGSSPVASSPVSELRHSTPVTFSKDMFGQQETENRPISTQALPQEPAQTVNPAALSPEMRPVAESSNATSSDLTQHPAAMLCDLQCQSEETGPWMDSASTPMGFRLLITALWATLSFEIFSSIATPLFQIVNSLSTGSPLSPTTSILNLMIWLTTTTASLTSQTPMMTSSTLTTSQRPRFSLRISLLRRLLACSPKLARPLKDATMEQMRRAVEQQLPDCLSSAGANRHSMGNSPSVEALMTLCWAIHVIEKELRLENTPKLGADMEGGQTAELTFRPTTKVRERDGDSFSFVRDGRRGSMSSGSGRSKKSLGDWRPVFDRPHGR